MSIGKSGCVNIYAVHGSPDAVPAAKIMIAHEGNKPYGRGRMA